MIESSEVVFCEECNGKGYRKIEVTRNDDLNLVKHTRKIKVRCKKCEGSGRFLREVKVTPFDPNEDNIRSIREFNNPKYSYKFIDRE